MNLAQADADNGRRSTARRKPAPAPEQQQKRARYGCAFEGEDDGGGKLAAPRLVWAKVRSHPWWPAQVVGAADASELALRHRPRRHGGARLVAFFWDMSFVWADAASLRPFRGGFPVLAGNGKGSSGGGVAPAVDAALAEVARRVAAGLSCSCFCNAGEEKQQQVAANAGVREGARGAVVDAAFAMAAFRGEAFVEYLSALAVGPGAGADRLELTVAMAQLGAFNRWRGGAMEAAKTAPASRATTTVPKRRRRRRARRGGAAAASADASAGNRTTALSRCARAAAAAAITMDAAAAAAQLSIAGNGDTEAATPPAGRATTEKTAGGSIGGDDAAAAAADDDRAGPWRMTGCNRSREKSAACEIDDDDDDAMEEQLDDDLEPFSPDHPSPLISSKTVSSKLGWKDCVIVVQFVAILLLACKLI